MNEPCLPVTAQVLHQLKTLHHLSMGAGVRYQVHIQAAVLVLDGVGLQDMIVVEARLVGHRQPQKVADFFLEAEHHFLDRLQSVVGFIVQ